MARQLVVKDLKGEIFSAQARINRIRLVNGERTLSSLSFLHGEINDEFLKDIEACWKVNFQGDWYHLFNAKEDKNGNKTFDAVLDFYFYMNQIWHMDEVENKSMTADDTLRPLFDNTDYYLQIIDNFYSNYMTYSKQENSTQRFMYFIERHKAEFNIPIGTKTVQLRNRIGIRREDEIIHEDDNLLNLDIDTDTASFCTAIECYYDYQKVSGSDDTKPTKQYTYISPMADKYGIIYGEPIADERFKDLTSVKEAARLKQESTYKVSFSVDASLFTVPLNEGDEVRFIVPSKSINTYIRVVEVNETFDEEGELIGASYTFGNENISLQYKQMQYDAVQDIRDIMLGKRPIPISVLPKAVREATAVINGGENTQFYYRQNEVYGVNQDNPLGITRYNANGIGFSQDGGKTYENAITYLGIVATAITSGTIDTNRVRIQGSQYYFYIDGDTLVAKDPDSLAEVRITPKGLKVTRYDGGVWMDGSVPRNEMSIQRNVFMSPSVSYTGQMYVTDSVSPVFFENAYFEHDGKYLRALFAYTLAESSAASSVYGIIRMREFGSGDLLWSGRFLMKKGETEYFDAQLTLGTPDFTTVKSFYLEFNVEGDAVTDNRIGVRCNKLTLRG